MSSRQKQPKRAAIHREDDSKSWLVRETEGQKKYDPAFKSADNKPFIEKCVITCELVYGKRVHHEGLDTIQGTTYHVLTGPTARKSMDDFAAKLNARKTPPSEMKKCLADGGRASSRNPGPGQWEFADLLRKQNPIS